MELDLVFLLIVFFFYFLSRLGGKKKPQRGPVPPQQRRAPEPGSQREENLELDQALREIREALGWPSSEPSPEAEPAPPHREPERAPAPARAERAQSPLEKSRPTSRPKSPAREQVGRKAARQVEPEQPPGEYAAYTGLNAATVSKKRQMALPPPESPGAARTNLNHPVLDRLRTPHGARDAVVYAEIFQPRWKKPLR